MNRGKRLKRRKGSERTHCSGGRETSRIRTLFHKLALIPSWPGSGLGADGLSSSSYGPEEAFKTLGSHTYLAVFLALATALTVLIIS